MVFVMNIGVCVWACGDSGVVFVMNIGVCVGMRRFWGGICDEYRCVRGGEEILGWCLW